MLSTTSILKHVFIAGLFFSCAFLHAQTSAIDTTDYILPYFSQANDYNLLIASSKGYTTEIERLIKKGADVNAETVDGATPLIYAVANNHKEAVKALLSHGPEVNKTTGDFQTPLLLAVKNQNVEVSELLIRGGADIDKEDNNGATPLHYASIYGSFYLCDLLLYYDAETDKKSNDGTTPLMAAIWAGYADLADLLIQNGANLEARDNQGFTPFLIAAQNGDTLLMKMLLKYGVDLYEKNIYNYNALDLAIEADHRPAVELLLEKGEKWSSHDGEGISPYKVASAFGRREYIEILEKRNIPGKVHPSIDEMTVSVASRFALKDIYGSIAISLKEPLLNAGFTAGVDTKLWYTRVLLKDSENLYYQYMDKSSLIYAGIFRDFLLTEKSGKSKLYGYASLSAGYAFGNKLKGTGISPDNKFIVLPAAGIKLQKNHFSLFAGLEYIRTDFYMVGPLWLRAGCSYNFYLTRLRSPGKNIKWY